MGLGTSERALVRFAALARFCHGKATVSVKIRGRSNKALQLTAR